MDRPIGEADAAADSIRQPVVLPTGRLGRSRRTAGVGGTAQAARMVKADGTARYPAVMQTTW